MTLVWSDHVAEAEWIGRVLHPFGQDVGSVVPEGFASYSRVFHPVRRGGDERMGWAQVAAGNGRLVHPEMQFHLVDTPAGATPSPRSEDRASSDLSWGSLPRAELTHLVELLSDATNTPNECWFAVWDGYGQLYGTPTVAWTRSDARAHSARRFARRQRLPRRTGQGSAPAERQDGAVPAEVLGGPRVHLPARDYLLLRGPIASAVAVHDDLGNQSPNLWWPSDHAWCVSTEIDFAWTYIGGAREVVDRILADPHLEALPATVHDHFTFNSDVLNSSLNG